MASLLSHSKKVAAMIEDAVKAVAASK